jgi:tRNA 2-thiouridine synthesizing protein D
MSGKGTLTFAIMDPPFETAGSTSVFRLVETAIRKGFDVKVFAYKGAVYLSYARQKPHGNAVHNRSAEEENHPLTKDWIAHLFDYADQKKVTLEWVNCGLCADERSVDETVRRAGRGGPADLWRMSRASDNTLVIGTR